MRKYGGNYYVRYLTKSVEWKARLAILRRKTQTISTSTTTSTPFVEVVRVLSETQLFYGPIRHLARQVTHVRVVYPKAARFIRRRFPTVADLKI